VFRPRLQVCQPADVRTMTKDELIVAVSEYGDATITYRSAESKKLKYNVCTLDFSNTYIQSKPNRAKETDDTVLMFCWDTDSFRLLRPANITTVLPLSASLKERKNG
jgi:hypothetical protein